MNSKDKINIFWFVAAILLGVYVINSVGSSVIALIVIVIVAVIAWATSSGNIR